MTPRKDTPRPPPTSQEPRTKTEGVALPGRSRGNAIKKAIPAALPEDEATVATLVRDVGAMIDVARRQVAVTTNAALTGLYWQIGRRVRTEVLDDRRAAYGEVIVAAVGRQLEADYGRGFGEKSLRHMIRFATAFPDAEIVSALRRQLSWTHFKQLSYIDDELKRTFYAEMCRVEGWSTRVLTERIDGMLFERTALSKKPDALVRNELAALQDKSEFSPALVFRDPYVLDFLDLADAYSEKEPPRKVLEERLHRAIEAARSRMVTDRER